MPFSMNNKIFSFKELRKIINICTKEIKKYGSYSINISSDEYESSQSYYYSEWEI